MKMSKSKEQSSKVTQRINAKALELLEQHQEGLLWSELLLKIKASDHKSDKVNLPSCLNQQLF